MVPAPRSNSIIPISGSMLFDFVRCAHRPVMDNYGAPAEKEPPNEFIQLLWEFGSAHEAEVVGQLQGVLSLKEVPVEARATATLRAMSEGVPLIYGGRLEDPQTGDIGEPDLLRLEGTRYVPGDVKSGAGEDEDGNPVVVADYCVQVAHYVKLLDRTGYGHGGERGFVLDGKGREVDYNLTAARGKRNPKTWWAHYEDTKAALRGSLDDPQRSLPARGAPCKLCPWKKSCYKKVDALDDLTRIAELGRSKRDALAPHFPTVAALANADLTQTIQGDKTGIPGVGVNSLRRMQDRAKLLASGGAPYLREPVHLPGDRQELHFDIEADPTRDLVYLHGFLVRDRFAAGFGDYHPVLIDGTSIADEAAGFARAWQFLKSHVEAGTPAYFYSPYERTSYRALARRHPQVCAETEVVELFQRSNVIDLYTDVIRSKTEWPLHDNSIKTIAMYLGFKWRDSNPSGAASIEWFDRWVKTDDPAVRDRILAYNADDLGASSVVCDGVRALRLRAA